MVFDHIFAEDKKTYFHQIQPNKLIVIDIVFFFIGALKCLSFLQIYHVVISRFQESTQARENKEDPKEEGGAGGRAHRLRQCRGECCQPGVQ